MPNMVELLEGVNRPAPWLDRDRWNLTADPDFDNDPGILEVFGEQAEALHAKWSKGATRKKLALMTEDQYEEYSRAIGAWFGWLDFDQLDDIKFPGNTRGKPTAVRLARFPLPSVVELARGLHCFRHRNNIEQAMWLTPFYMRWGPARMEVLAAEMETLFEKYPEQVTDKRTEMLDALRNGVWPAKMGVGHTHELTAGVPVPVRSQPYDWATADLELIPGVDTCCTDGIATNGFSRLSSHTGWIDTHRLRPATRAG